MRTLRSSSTLCSPCPGLCHASLTSLSHLTALGCLRSGSVLRRFAVFLLSRAPVVRNVHVRVLEPRVEHQPHVDEHIGAPVEGYHWPHAAGSVLQGGRGGRVGGWGRSALVCDRWVAAGWSLGAVRGCEQRRITGQKGACARSATKGTQRKAPGVPARGITWAKTHRPEGEPREGRDDPHI